MGWKQLFWACLNIALQWICYTYTSITLICHYIICYIAGSFVLILNGIVFLLFKQCAVLYLYWVGQKHTIRGWVAFELICREMTSLCPALHKRIHFNVALSENICLLKVGVECKYCGRASYATVNILYSVYARRCVYLPKNRF